ncbi:MAG: PD40 domain-containing protein [Chitinivibrionales bacterium]|nr:PD40 domain-containing protein [Chitinivibrionales bacterium]
MYRCILLISLIPLVCWSGRIDLESYVRNFDSIPIAVVKFQSSDGSALSQDYPWEVIADDLDFSSKFAVVRMESADSALLAEKNIGIYIDGEYMLNSGEIVLDCFVRDAITREILLGKKYRGSVAASRAIAHRFSNQIYSMLFGEKGIYETKIVYIDDRYSTKNICIMQYDGYNNKVPFSKEVLAVFPTFLDSTSLVWTSFQRGKPDLYRGSLVNGSYGPIVVSRNVCSSPEACPVIGRIAFAWSKSGSLDIYSCDYSGNDRKQLTFFNSIETSPCWSPTGGQIAFISDRTGQPQLYVMDADGTNIKRLTFEGEYHDSPSWSPKGDLIAIASLRGGKFDIWAIAADGATKAKKVTSLAGNNEYPSWSPDASYIAFSNTQRTKSNIFCIRPNGSGLKQLTNSGKAKMPEWSKF